MIGRRQFTSLGLSLGALGAMAPRVFAADESGGGEHEHDDHDHDHAMMGGKTSECAKACSDCARACSSCSTHCAEMLGAGKAAHKASLMSCQDCADVCNAAAEIVSRRGPMTDLICRACADACGLCGKECEKFPSDKHMTMCAKECRRCEKACRDMLKRA